MRNLHLKGVSAVLGVCAVLGGFVAWSDARTEHRAALAESRAAAEADRATQAVAQLESKFEQRDAGMREEIRRVETKVDKVLELLLSRKR